MQILLSLSISLFAGLMLSRIAKLAKLPAVTAYLIAGILVGTYLLGAFGVEGLGFTSMENIHSFSLISDVALGFIAFSIGNEFRLNELKHIGKKATIIGIFQAVFTTLVVDAALITLHFIIPEHFPIEAAIILGAVASATAPAATLMVVKQYKASFVDREHTNNDVIGNNTVPEGLEYGEPVIAYESYSALDDGEQGYLTVFACTKLRNGQVLTGWNNVLGGVFNSLYTFACESYADAKRVVECYNSTDGISGDDIQNIYLVPKICVNMNVNQAFQVGGAGDNINVHPLNNFVSSSEKKIQQQNALYGGYVPVNNKLYCYPYSYIYATNNAGESVEYRWEDFKLEKSDAGNYQVMTARYIKDYVPTSGVSAKLRFTNYKNQGTPSSYAEQTWSYGLTFGKIPVCAWTTDYYTNWLTQNGINTIVSTTSSVVNSMASMTTGNVIGGATSLGSTIGGLLGTMQQVRNTPNQAKGDASSADVGFTYMSNIIQFFHMTVRPEFARIIDEYFSVYGYKTNRIKIPNVNGRRNWNYVKTVGCYIRANIPQSDLQEIKNIFDKGVTFWHNPATFLDYSQPNPIV